MAARTFQDSAGVVWEAFEVHRSQGRPAAVSEGMERGWLAFVNGSEKRRLAPFPPTWFQAAPAELERLCASARAAGRISSGSERAVRTPVAEAVTVAIVPAGELLALEEAVRTFAREARAASLPAIEAMVRLKAMLLERHPERDGTARDLRSVRRWFVDAYYFEKNA